MSRKKSDIHKRKMSFFQTNPALVSPFVGILLSCQEDSAKLTESIRNTRNGNKGTFTICDKCKQKVEEYEKGNNKTN